MNITKLFSSVKSIFKKLGNLDRDIEILSSAISKAAPIVNQIYPIVVKIGRGQVQRNCIICGRVSWMGLLLTVATY